MTRTKHSMWFSQWSHGQVQKVCWPPPRPMNHFHIMSQVQNLVKSPKMCALCHCGMLIRIYHFTNQNYFQPIQSPSHPWLTSPMGWTSPKLVQITKACIGFCTPHFPSVFDKYFILYILVSSHIVVSILVQQANGHDEHVIYYINKTLEGKHSNTLMMRRSH